jgi:hypothetical protein
MAMTPHFAYFEAENGIEIRFYYAGNDNRTTYRHITIVHDHIEATELCVRLNDLMPLIGMLYVQNDPVFALPDH